MSAEASFGAAACAAVLIAASVRAADVIAVDPGAIFQTISGWEATCWAGQDSPQYSLFRDALLERGNAEVMKCREERKPMPPRPPPAR